MAKRDDETFSAAHDAFNRMARAYARGTGCHLTADMIFSLSLTHLGEMWGEQNDPRKDTPNGH